MNHSRIITATSLATMFAICSAKAATITQTVFGQDWDNAIWGSPAAATPTSGNDYVTAGGGNIIRTNNDSSASDSVFAGDSLTLASGTRMLMKNTSDSSSTITSTTTPGNLIMQGAVIDHSPNSLSTATLNANNLIVSGNNEFALGSSTLLAINATLTGSGNLYFAERDNNQNTSAISISDISAYTGTITVGDNPNTYSALSADFGLTLDFGVDHYFQNSFTLLNSSILKINSAQTLTFNVGDLIDGVTPIGVGTYDSTSGLGSSFSFVDGTGSIVVIPEPSTALLGALGALALFRRRRN